MIINYILVGLIAYAAFIDPTYAIIVIANMLILYAIVFYVLVARTIIGLNTMKIDTEEHDIQSWQIYISHLVGAIMVALNLSSLIAVFYIPWLAIGLSSAIFAELLKRGIIEIKEND